MNDLENTFSWSVSRNKIFTECRRAYYYRHYGSWGGWKEDAPAQTREAYILKLLNNRFTLAGRIVHEVVADTLNRHRYGREVEVDEARVTALEMLRNGFRESRDGKHRKDPKNKVGLFEHEYQENIPDREWQRIRDRVFVCIDHFFSSKIRSAILGTQIENWLPVDSLDSFDFEGTKVYVAPDFVLRNPQGNALLIDWKTGRPEASEDRTQIVCYGLFARNKWGVNPLRAIGELHYLLSGAVDIVTLDDSTLEKGKSHIRNSIREMLDSLDDVKTNRAEIDSFPKTDNRITCSRCNFRRLCWPDWPDTEPAST